MTLNIPSSADEIKQKAQTDVQTTLPDSNPFLPNSYLDAIITSFSGRIYDFYLQLLEVIRQLFVDTATGTFLERWGSYVNILRKSATQATGNITFTGTVSSVIPISTQLSTSDGLIYQTAQSVTILTQSIQVTQITRIGSLAIVETPSPHLLTSLQSVTISGANQTEYNGTFTINVTGSQEFTYTVSGTPVTPATGTIIASADFASVSVTSIDFGSSTNLDANTPLTLSTPIAGVDNTARVQFTTISGGSNQENDEDLRARILFRYQNPVSLFNENAIIVKAQEVPGVTRVFVFGPGSVIRTLSTSSVTRVNSIVTVTTTSPHYLEDGQTMSLSGANQSGYNGRYKVIVIDNTHFAYSIASTPTTPATGTITVDTTIPNGQVMVYFTRDNDANIIPTASEVATVKNALVNYNTGIKPASVSSLDVIVRAPIPVTVNFVFTLIEPDTTTMRNAITANLQAFFRENTSVGQDVPQVAYQAVIFRTIDTETGSVLTNFTLSSPSTDITVQSDEIAILGTVTFT